MWPDYNQQWAETYHEYFNTHLKLYDNTNPMKQPKNTIADILTVIHSHQLHNTSIARIIY